MFDDREDAEGPEGGERVGDDVVEQRGEAAAGVGDEGEQHVSGMGDGGVGEQAAEAGLADGDEVAEEHRERGDHGERGHPARNAGGEGGRASAPAKARAMSLEEDEEAGDLGGRRR